MGYSAQFLAILERTACSSICVEECTDSELDLECLNKTMMLCKDIEQFARWSFFASGGAIIIFLLLNLMLLLTILHMKIKINKLRKR